MNEVTKVHLGRQAFTMSVDAHHKLKNYLDAVAKQVKDKEIINEIEFRMAELLTERGLSNKVVLPDDIDFLMKQLGSPDEFKDGGDEASADATMAPTKRLYRDTDNALVAGVAAGLAAYFGLDILLVRLLFVLLVLITFGWGILLYVLLWLLVPEAKTPSDRLQMAGKPVTVGSLQELIDNADVKGAARRVHKNLSQPINRAFSLLLKLVGAGFVLLGLTALFGLIAGEVYFLANRDAWLQNNIFPVGLREQLTLHLGVGIAALITLFTILLGVAIFRRRWPIRAWITGVLLGLMLIGLAAGSALTADIYPSVRDRYNANTHTLLRTVPAFNAINATGEGVEWIDYQQSNAYYVALNYYGHPNLASIKTTVTQGTLNIDTTQFNWHRNCSTLCIPASYRLSITVYSPNAFQLQNQANFKMPQMMWAPKPAFTP